MTGDDWKQFAFGVARTAKLATVRAELLVHVHPTHIVGHRNMSA